MEYKIQYKTVILKLSDNPETICAPAAVETLIKNDPEFDPTVEQMWLIGLNIKNNVHLKHLIAKGGYNSLMTSPADIFGPALRLNLRNLILCHNHPSDDNGPSDQDIIFTKKIKSGCELLGLNLLDHVIVSNNGHYSFKKNNLI